MIQRLIPLLVALVAACAAPAETVEPEARLATARYYVIADT